MPPKKAAAIPASEKPGSEKPKKGNEEDAEPVILGVVEVA